MRWLVLIIALLFAHTSYAHAPPLPLNITVVSPSSTNCPTTPPPQAARAGFTTLLYCLDPATAKYQNIPGWFDCGETRKPGFEWYINFSESIADFSCANNLSIVTDSTDGRPVLQYHWRSAAAPAGDNMPNSQCVVKVGIETTGSWSPGTSTLTVASPTGIVNGLYVINTNIPTKPLTTVTNVSGNTVTVSQNLPATQTNPNIFFTDNNWQPSGCIYHPNITKFAMADFVNDTTFICYAATGPNCGSFFIPANADIEVRMRTSPLETGIVERNNPPPDFFTWGACYLGPRDLRFCNDVLEKDVLEMYGGRGGGMVKHDWAPGCTNPPPSYTGPKPPAGCNGEPANYNSNGNVIKQIPTFSEDQFHTYGWMTTSDGAFNQWQCGYVDNTPIVGGMTNTFNFDSSGCMKNNYAACPNNFPPGTYPAACSPGGDDETGAIHTPLYLNWWFGGSDGPDSWRCQRNNPGGTFPYDPLAYPSPCTQQGGQGDQFTYIEWIAVWGCANAPQPPVGTSDMTCFVPGKQPTQ